MKIIAASPLVNHGEGSAHSRIVLRVLYNAEDQPIEYVTHRQYFYGVYRSPEDHSPDSTDFVNGDYFTHYGKALENFYKRSKDNNDIPAALTILERFEKVQKHDNPHAKL